MTVILRIVLFPIILCLLVAWIASALADSIVHDWWDDTPTGGAV